MFLLRLLTLCLLVSPVFADETVVVNSLLILTEDVEDGVKTKWILPEGFDDSILQDSDQLVFFPKEVGQIEFLFIRVTTDDITCERIKVDVVDKEAEVQVTAPASPPEKERRVAVPTVDLTPIIVLHTMTPCPLCDRWKIEELPKLKKTGWKYAEDKTGYGVNRFPSFAVRVGKKNEFHEGIYLTANQITLIVERLQK